MAFFVTFFRNASARLRQLEKRVEVANNHSHDDESAA